jgi:hypothetical protein
MKKLNVNELKESLLNKEFSFIELDNFMSKNGYYSVLDDGVTSNIKQDLNVIYTALDTQECEVKIIFEITENNGEDEVEESFFLKVLDVEEF